MFQNLKHNKYFCTVIFLAAFFSLQSCRKKVKSPKGGIDIISNVYIGASKNLENRKTFLVSKLNYSGDSILELIPETGFPQMIRERNFILDSLYFTFGEGNVLLSEIQKKQKSRMVFQKTRGAIFTNQNIINYRNRRNLSDTMLFGKKYKRFEINSPWNYTRYYIFPTDTILPYNIYKEAAEDYGGRIERIDAYNKKQDVFVSMQLIPRRNWDDEARDFFKFNHFAQRRR
ncbi:hypothetical protein [Chryseobacterium taklimakanense]|uniref:hypothetical protein n=1 Tax=Chryseobacterium taklimakanense TaxID=536441 RepID=UPI001E3A97AC|nr:hypothetical protein [Chryseobacterium taklimakanense]